MHFLNERFFSLGMKVSKQLYRKTGERKKVSDTFSHCWWLGKKPSLIRKQDERLSGLCQGSILFVQCWEHPSTKGTILSRTSQNIAMTIERCFKHHKYLSCKYSLIRLSAILYARPKLNRDIDAKSWWGLLSCFSWQSVNRLDMFGTHAATEQWLPLNISKSPTLTVVKIN